MYLVVFQQKNVSVCLCLFCIAQKQKSLNFSCTFSRLWRDLQHAAASKAALWCLALQPDTGSLLEGFFFFPSYLQAVLNFS